MTVLPPDGQGWKGGQSADQQGMGFLIREIRQIKAELAALKGAAPLRAAGVHASPAGLSVDSSLAVSGNLDVTGGATFGGTTTIAGNAAITGTLSLPAGIIDNEALSAPLSYIAGGNNSAALNLSATEQTICTLNWTVPAGYTRALIQGTGTVGVVNPTASPSSLAARIYIDTPAGNSFGARRFQRVEPGFDGAVVAIDQEDYEGMVGGQTITVRLAVMNTGPDWGATPGGGTLTAFALFTR